MSNVVVYEDKPETTEQRRRRLANELLLKKEEFNQKLAEVVDEGLDVDVFHQDGSVISGEDALMVRLDVSYQTKRKYYR